MSTNLLKVITLYFCLFFLYSTEAFSRDTANYGLETVFTVDDIINDPDGVFDFIEDKINYLSSDIKYLSNPKNACIIPSCRTHLEHAEYLQVLASKAIYSFYILRDEEDFSSLQLATSGFIFKKKLSDEYLTLISKLDYALINVMNYLPLKWDYFELSKVFGNYSV